MLKISVNITQHVKIATQPFMASLYKMEIYHIIISILKYYNLPTRWDMKRRKLSWIFQWKSIAKSATICTKYNDKIYIYYK